MEKHLKSGVFQSLFLQMHTISGFHYSTLTIYPSLRGLGCRSVSIRIAQCQCANASQRFGNPPLAEQLFALG